MRLSAEGASECCNSSKLRDRGRDIAMTTATIFCIFLSLSLSPRISEGKDVLSQGKESNAEWVLIENEKGPSSSFSISESREGNEVNPSQLSQFPVGA